MQAKYAKLRDRYGETGAKAVLGAMVLLTPVPLPGTSLLPIALAEAVLKVRKVLGASREKAMPTDLTPEHVAALARDLWHELNEEMQGPDVGPDADDDADDSDTDTDDTDLYADPDAPAALLAALLADVHDAHIRG